MNFLSSLIRPGRQVEVNSSAISKVSYHRRMRELDVQFTSGANYQYGCVEPHTYKELISAPSTGKYFVSEIRGRYPYRRMEG